MNKLLILASLLLVPGVQAQMSTIEIAKTQAQCAYLAISLDKSESVWKPYMDSSLAVMTIEEFRFEQGYVEGFLGAISSDFEDIATLRYQIQCNENLKTKTTEEVDVEIYDLYFESTR